MVDQQRIVITGASRGVGAELRDYYLSLGCYVVGCSRSEVEFSHQRYQHYAVDVAKEESVVDFFFALKASTVDVLINNAGLATMNHLLLTPGASIDTVLDTNLKGAILCTREAAKIMGRKGYGRIVNLTSVGVPMRIAGESIYVASKAGLESFTRTAAKELADFGITVNALGLSPIHTDMIAGLPQEKLDTVLAQQAIARYAELKDIANAIDFFIQAESDFVTGQVLYLGGAG